jgi:hypothetical protein
VGPRAEGAASATDRADDRRTVAWLWSIAPGPGPPEVSHVPSSTTNPSVPGWWPWGLGLLVALAVVGPGLAMGPMLSFDLQVTPSIEVPPGVFGLGPGLSQRVPLFALLGLGSALVGGPAATVLFLVACVTVGFAGSVRLARLVVANATPVATGAVAVAAGLLWAAGPFALTRVGAGHLNLAWMVAVLPWALPRLCRPGDHPPSTFLAALLLALGGPGAGTIGLAGSAVALIRDRARPRWPAAVLASLVPHLVWVAPTAVLWWAGAEVSGAADFATHPGGLLGWPAVLVGNGFWRADLQVGATGLVGGVAGMVVGALAIAGARPLLADPTRPRWQRSATFVATTGLALSLASALPPVRGPYRWASDLAIGAPLRESQRFLALWLVWAAPLAASGAISLARWRPRGSVGAGVPAFGLLAVALVTAVPGWWGIEGRLVPVAIPASWDAARERIDEDPGPVVALPWVQHPRLSFAAGRQAFNPVPPVLGGDVISSYDPLFDRDQPAQEQVDRRAQVVDEVVRDLRAGRPVAGELARLGVRWVVLVHESEWRDYRSLEGDPGLALRLREPDLDLYEVRAWQGPAVAPDGSVHRLDRPIRPLLQTDAPAGSVLDVAGAPGWVQGWGRPVAVTDDGRLRLPAEGGLVWFWPATALLVLDVGLALGAGVAIRSRRGTSGRILAPSWTRG